MLLVTLGCISSGLSPIDLENWTHAPQSPCALLRLPFGVASTLSLWRFSFAFDVTSAPFILRFFLVKGGFNILPLAHALFHFTGLCSLLQAVLEIFAGSIIV
jgi:hypothetical protein